MILLWRGLSGTRTEEFLLSRAVDPMILFG